MTKILIVYADDREPLQMRKKLEKLGLKVERKRLKEGDYVFRDICMERKTIDDFCDSIMDDRLVKQVKKMKAKYTKVYILISGSIKKRTNKNFLEHCILGKIASLLIRDNLSIVMVDNDTQLAYLIERIVVKKDDEDSRRKNVKIL